MPAIKVVEIVGVSDRSWHDAVNNALVEAAKTIRGITGILPETTAIPVMIVIRHPGG